MRFTHVPAHVGETNDSMPLKSLTDHNNERQTAFLQHMVAHPVPNGIYCPKCIKHELMDSDPMCTLTVSPPQKRVHCDFCGYHGTRLA